MCKQIKPCLPWSSSGVCGQRSGDSALFGRRPREILKRLPFALCCGEVSYLDMLFYTLYCLTECRTPCAPCVAERVVGVEQSPCRARLICLTVLSSPAAFFVIVRSYNGLVPLGQSEERGVNSPKTDNAGMAPPWVRGSSRPQEPSSQLPSASWIIMLHV